ncbi:site-specific integrase [Alkalihalophilus pseudofirmus]|uniref:tyrosine-type recombinase/integrase n=1 Tax=Alkalihalophilus pseudofirmus TaxID=79885 RepID=UPI00259B7DCB|nr:site-specific integrase [Alkalihalophilus pseudofirmus]WEG18572.1 site-specific integrase [Alkalihalophilus pseudofirmus]
MELAYIHKVNVEEIINKFIETKIDKPTTRNSYRTHIRDFYLITMSKQLNELIEKDLIISHNIIDTFMVEGKRKWSNNTINTKMAAIKSFYKYLESRVNDFMLSVEIDFSILKGSDRLKTQKINYGKLTYDEVVQMSEIVFETERNKAKNKSAFLLFALDTGLRKEEIQKVQWRDLRVIDNDQIYFQVVGKGDVIHQRIIKKELYSIILNAKEDDKYLFPLSNTEIQYMFDRLRAYMNIPEERNIVFHSIRKASVTEYYYLTLDPLATQKFAGHQSFDTTTKYIQEKDFGNIGVMSMRETVNSDDLKSLDKNELLELIDNNNEIKIRLINELRNK